MVLLEMVSLVGLYSESAKVLLKVKSRDPFRVDGEWLVTTF